MNKVIVCRCEGVYFDEIVNAINDGATSVQGIKRRCRVGMGYCQGRTCQPVIRDLLISMVGSNSLEQIQRTQSPIRPVLLRDL